MGSLGKFVTFIEGIGFVMILWGFADVMMLFIPRLAYKHDLITAMMWIHILIGLVSIVSGIVLRKMFDITFKKIQIMEREINLLKRNTEN